MKIEQFEDKGLAQYSYAILDEDVQAIVLIDPARDPKPYYAYAKKENAKISAVILTHSHADFVSSHLEIQEATGAAIFVSSRMDASFPHKKVEEGDIITLGELNLKALYTPGHSEDSISILLEKNGKETALFSGDTLFVGDVGRPDLRGNGENADQMRRDLAGKMYDTIHTNLKLLSPEITVYPGHGAGTLCGKSLSTDPSTTIGREIKENYAFQEMGKEEFIENLLENQPFIPLYFSYDVKLNHTGAVQLERGISNIKRLERIEEIGGNNLIIDGRQEKEFKRGHLKGAINIQNGGKFETWLGSIVPPEQKFILIAADEKESEELIRKAAKIGYETNIQGVLIRISQTDSKSPVLDMPEFKKNPSQFTIVDIRNEEEVAENKIFENSINIPSPLLSSRIKEIPLGKPIVVHCAGGYRSSIGSSILEKELAATKVFDLSEAIKEFQEVKV